MARDSPGPASRNVQPAGAGTAGRGTELSQCWLILALRACFPSVLPGKLGERWSHWAAEDIVLQICYFWMGFPGPLSPCGVEHGCSLELTETPAVVGCCCSESCVPQQWQEHEGADD